MLPPTAGALGWRNGLTTGKVPKHSVLGVYQVLGRCMSEARLPFTSPCRTRTCTHTLPAPPLICLLCLSARACRVCCHHRCCGPPQALQLPNNAYDLKYKSDPALAAARGER